MTFLGLVSQACIINRRNWHHQLFKKLDGNIVTATVIYFSLLDDRNTFVVCLSRSLFALLSVYSSLDNLAEELISILGTNSIRPRFLHASKCANGVPGSGPFLAHIRHVARSLGKSTNPLESRIPVGFKNCQRRFVWREQK